MRRPRILLVDDEPNVLESLRDVLHRSFDVETAVGGAEALEKLQVEGPFEVLVTDMRMPEIGGSEVLSMARRLSPDTVRLLLTGHADIDAAIEAVNNGQVFRFLTKPCSKEVLVRALVDATNQHRLLTSERVLIEQTLSGAVQALTDVLALVNPVAFGRATRLRCMASEFVRAVKFEQPWQIEMAAMLSQVGCLSLPQETAERYYSGAELSLDELALIERVPVVAARLLRPLPKLEPVTEILQQQTWFGSANRPNRAANILRIVLDFDLLDTQGRPADLALAEMRSRGYYDLELLNAFSSSRAAGGTNGLVRELPLGEVRPGMTFTEDVRSERDGTLLIARGQEVTESLLEHKFKLPENELERPVHVIENEESKPPEASQAA